MSNFYPSKEQQEQIKEATEERRCDLCKYGNDTPCTRQPCNSVNGLQHFEPKGSETEDHGCPHCATWATVTDFTYCPKCGQVLK